MATAKQPQDDLSLAYDDDDQGQNATPSGAPPTYASFSPVTLSAHAPTRSRPSTILVHQKSPLLLATPPQITRALAYSHPFLLPMNKAVGLLSWTTGDPWESFLLVCAFWAIVLYSDFVIRTAGPIVLVLILMLAMYGRRYSPLSSSGWNEPKARNTNNNASAQGGNQQAAGSGGKGGHQRTQSEATNTKHQKTLDEIVDTLKEFTGRCNILLGPALELTDFLSTQLTPTSATTRPALTALFIRILCCTPFWYALTLSPWRIITLKRVILLEGTLVLTWHARVMRVARTILWRSAMVRRAVSLVTGLELDRPARTGAAGGRQDTKGGDADLAETVTASADGPVPKVTRATDSELTKALRRRGGHHTTRFGHNVGGRDAGVKFTFIIYENQRRWVGLGWTQSLFAYERGAWTDEHNNPVPAKDDFELPEVEDGSNMRWRWVEGSRWRVDGVNDERNKEIDYDGDAGKNGWIYYDNKWLHGKRGADGWGKWTRRRKWYRDAELVEDDDARSDEGPAELSATNDSTSRDLSKQSYSTIAEKMISPTQTTYSFPADSTTKGRPSTDGADEKDASAFSMSTSSGSSKRSFFRKSMTRRGTNQSNTTIGSEGGKSSKTLDRIASEAQSDEETETDEVGRRLKLTLQGQGQGSGGGWGIGDEARMNLE